MEQEQTPQTNELLILQALEAIMSTQKNHSLMLIALLEILASPSESPSMKDLINLGLFKVTEIAKIEDDKIVALEENFLLFMNNIKSFTTQISQTITSPSKLAKMMAGKARLLQNVIERAIISGEIS